ncbi:MAG: hypothetical protein QOH97_3622 [Actinoplanes sp.]|nr:hypothetical protein [Actinoplanes sp.]
MSLDPIAVPAAEPGTVPTVAGPPAATGTPLRRFTVTVREVTRYEGWVLAADRQAARESAEEMVVATVLQTGTYLLRDNTELDVTMHRH